MDGGEPQITAADGYASFLLQFVQKCHNQRSIDLLDVHA
jgi:hypothetical protein